MSTATAGKEHKHRTADAVTPMRSQTLSGLTAPKSKLESALHRPPRPQTGSGCTRYQSVPSVWGEYNEEWNILMQDHEQDHNSRTTNTALRRSWNDGGHRGDHKRGGGTSHKHKGSHLCCHHCGRGCKRRPCEMWSGGVRPRPPTPPVLLHRRLSCATSIYL